MAEWQPIDTAPRDGTLIDVWAVSEDGKTQGRLTNVSWEEVSDWMGNVREDWFPTYRNPHQPKMVPAYWMPLPQPPKEEG